MHTSTAISSTIWAASHKGLHLEQVITHPWAIMGRYDPEHHTRFVIDEWGVWYRGGTELGPPYILSQTITLRDALANVAQTINCLHSLFGRQVHADAAVLHLRDVSPSHGRAGRADDDGTA
jgi:alpha-L-arabinofuranosidase